MSATLLERIEAAPEHAPALADDERPLSYGELRSEVARVATALRERFEPGAYLPLRAPMRADFVVSLLAIQRAGCIPVPIDPEAPAELVGYVHEKCGAPAVLDPLPPAAAAEGESAPVPVSDTAMVLFTSGTSGFPKGVVISQANLAHSCDAVGEYLDYPQWNSAAVVLPLHYSYALLSQVCAQLWAGGFVRLFPNFRNPIKFARAVEELQLRSFCGVPSTYVGLAMTHGMKPLSMPSVRVLCSAGAAMDRARYDTIKEIFPNATFFNNYGMTEASPRIAWISDRDPRFHEATCGRPMRGVEVRVVDTESGGSVAAGGEGILAVRGANVTSGYLNDPERTRRAFTADGFLLTGDIAHLDDGYIFLRGRSDDLFNVAGEKVAPLEIERVLDRCPGVEGSAVVGWPDDVYGRIPLAFVMASDELSASDLAQFLKGRLSSAKTPRRYYKVRAFPRTANGKLQRRMLSPDADFVEREIR